MPLRVSYDSLRIKRDKRPLVCRFGCVSSPILSYDTVYDQVIGQIVLPSMRIR
jgi:hypothetical protein